MAECISTRQFLGIVVAIILSMHMYTLPTSAARVDINNMDYEELLTLLSEQDHEESVEVDLVPSESNNIPRFNYNVEQNLNPTVSKNYASNLEFSITKPSASSLLAPHVEILHIVETFMRLKGEMATRMHALISDNFDLIQSIYNVIVAKASKLHGFTLMGIGVVRRILEFAVQMIGTWEVNAPSVSIGVNKVFNAIG